MPQYGRSGSLIGWLNNRVRAYGRTEPTMDAEILINQKVNMIQIPGTLNLFPEEPPDILFGTGTIKKIL